MSDESAFAMERYKHVCTMIRYHNDKMIEAFNRFNTFVVSIIGGAYALLSVKDLSVEARVQVVGVVPILLDFVALSSAAIIYSNYKSWHGFRLTQASLSSGAVPKPRFPRSASEQIFMFLIFLAVCIGYRVINPFSSFLVR